MSNYQVKDNHIAAEYDVNGNVITQDEVNERVKGEIKWLKENGTALSPEQVTNLAKIPTLSSQLDESMIVSVKQPSLNNVNLHNKNIICTFIDDDGNREVSSILKPIFTSRNVPCCCAVIGTSVYMTDKNYIDEMRTLQNEKRWEVLSHTMNHINLNTSTDDVIEKDCVDFMKLSAKNGYNVSSICYPWGAVTATGADIISKHFKSGFIASQRNNIKNSVNLYGLGRYSLGSMMDSSLNTLQGFKDVIDNAKDGQWLVFMTHCSAEQQTGTPLIEQVLDYVISKNIPVVNVREAMRTHGQIICTKNFKLNADGSILSNDYQIFNGTDLNIDSTTAPNMFKPKGITIKTFPLNATGFPTSGGQLETDVTSESVSYWKQIWKPFDQNKIYMRRATSVSAWGAWQEIGASTPIDMTKIHRVIATAKLEADLITTYEDGITTRTVTGFSCGNGILTTYKINGNGWDKQELRKTLGNDIYSRYVDGSGNWTAWVKITP